jgi:hypothetical protein
VLTGTGAPGTARHGSFVVHLAPKMIDRRDEASPGREVGMALCARRPAYDAGGRREPIYPIRKHGESHEPES